MNDRLSSAPAAAPGGPPLVEPIDASLPRGLRLGSFEIERVLARRSSTVVYLATDHALAMPVAIQEYLPARLARRDAGLHLRAAEPWHDDVIARGRRAFIDEARMLAHCDHPALVRVTQLFEALGSAYRVMPVCTGPRLTEVRGEMTGAPDESALRALLYPLLGAIEAIHHSGEVHGGVSPSNILLLADDRPLLLGPGAAGREIGSDLVDSLMATLEATTGAVAPVHVDADAGALPVGAARDLYALAETLRFCITGEALAPPGTLRAREPLAHAIAREYPPETRPQYSPALLGTLDAALSPFAEDRPLTAAQFRDWLERGVPGGPIRVAPAARPPAPAPTPAPMPIPDAAADPAIDATQPMAPWPEDLGDLTGDPITPDRPPWIPPSLASPLQHATTARARHRKLLLAAGFAMVALVGLAGGAFWWNIVPEIRLEPTPERTATAPAAAAPEPASPPQEQPQEQPQTRPQTQPQPPRQPDSVAATETAAAPPPQQQQQPVAPAPAPEAEAAPKAIAPVDPDRSLAVNPPAAAPNSSARPVTNARVAPAGAPRDACAGRTEFALYRCMLQQCQVKRWATHPQCVKLKRDDRVD